MRTDAHILEALRFASKLPCKKSNCGTVCLCGSCHARKSLPEMEQREEKNRKALRT